MRKVAESEFGTLSADKTLATAAVPAAESDEEMLLFGVDSSVPAGETLQNNLAEYEWVTRNKLEPNFWGRNMTGENCLTQEEIEFLHKKGCRIAPTFSAPGEKETEAQGRLQAKKIVIAALELGIREKTAIFLELGEENATRDYLLGYAKGMLSEGYIPGFKACTDSRCEFDHEFSRGLQSDKEVFSKCLIWAVTPSLQEYDRITTTHLIHPDNWTPYAPSGIRRQDIAVWQYGKNCHPIYTDAGKEVTFQVNLIRNISVLFDHMF